MRVERWGWYSVALNLGLIGTHAAVASISGSLAVTAELTHNVVDLVSAGAVLVGLHLAERTSARFPYGLHKVENLVAAGIAVLVFVTAYEIGRTAVTQAEHDVDTSGWMVASLVVTLVAPLVFSRYELRAALAANSPSLIAEAREYRVHAATTGLALLSLVAAYANLRIDRIAAGLIVLVVARTGWQLLRDAMRSLLDASLDIATLRQIEHVITEHPTVRLVNWVNGRNAGRYSFVEAGVTLRTADLATAERAIDRIEAAVRAAVPHVDRVLLHVEAPSSPVLRYAVPLADRTGPLSEHFGKSPWFALIDIDRAHGTVREDRRLPNPHHDLERRAGMRAAEWLVSNDVDVVLATESLQGKGPAHVLGEAGIELAQTIAHDPLEAVNAHRSSGAAPSTRAAQPVDEKNPTHESP